MKDYEVGAIFNALYAVERNVRIQNVLNEGFYGCNPLGMFASCGIKAQDFSNPDPTAANHEGWKFDTSLNDLCNFLLTREYKDIHDVADHVKHEPKTKLEHILVKAHESGWQFIIEMISDAGFFVYLMNSNIENQTVIECDTYPAEKIGEWILNQTMMNEKFYA